MTAAELAEKLERLDALFVDLYRYAESCTVTGMNAQQAGQALRSIKNTIGNRHNVIPQAAARLRSMEEALKPFVSAFEDARDQHAARYGERTELGRERFDAMPGHWPMDVLNFSMADFRRARAALQGEKP